jgi:predicted transcriptional regulator
VTMSLELDDDLQTRVQHLADVQQCSAHAVMHVAIREYLEREGDREKLEAELRTWLKPWDAGNEVAIPDQ